MRYIYFMIIFSFFNLNEIIGCTFSNNKEWFAYMPEMRRILVSKLVEESKELSKKLPKSKKNKPFLFLMRGNSGAGKSEAITSLPFHIHQGTINPDIAKYRLREMCKKELNVDLSYQQVDGEGEKIFSQWVENFVKAHKNCSFVIDRRMLRVSDVENKLSLAKIAGAEVYLIDVEAPFEVSCIRCLTRPRCEKNPRVDYDCIEDGYRKIHQERAELIHHILNPSENSSFKLVTHYELRYSDGILNCLVAAKDPQQGWVIYHPDLFNQIVYQSEDKTEKIIESVGKTIINDAFIAKILKLNFIQALKKDGLNDLITEGMENKMMTETVIQILQSEPREVMKIHWKKEIRKHISLHKSEQKTFELERIINYLADELTELRKLKGQSLSTVLIAQ